MAISDFNIEDILFLMILGFSLAAPLGPVNMEMIKQVLRSKFGYILGIFTGFGALTGDFLVASFVLFLSIEFLKDFVENFYVFIILSCINIGILLFIGINAIKNNEIENLDSTENNLELDNRLFGILKQYIIGLIIVITSPWSYFWWASFGGILINSGLPLFDIGDRLIAIFFFLTGILVWILLLTYSLRLSRKFASDKILKFIIKGSAYLIIAFAILITYETIAFIFNFPSLR